MAEGGVLSVRIVPAFDVAEYDESGLGVRGEAVFGEQLTPRTRLSVRGSSRAGG